MKKGWGIKVLSVLGGLLLFSGLQTGSANYIPNEKDTKEVGIITNKIKEIVGENKKDLRNFYNQFKILEKQIGQKVTEKNKLKKIHYLLGKVKAELDTILQLKKQKSKLAAENQKKIFVNKYITGVITSKDSTARCKNHYKLIDDIAFSHDFPTALIISTRYREASCRFYLPGNGYGPFQIISKNYGTGTLTEEKFSTAIIDFINFSKEKHQRYKNKVNINLTYENIDLESIVNHASLYNGGRLINGLVVPIEPSYIFDSYKGEFSQSRRYGILAATLKFLNEELKGNYK